MAYFKIHVDNFEKGDLGEDVKKGDLLYLGSDGKYYKASASDKERSTTELKIAESDGGFLDTDVKLLAYGEFTYTDFPLVPGDKYYVSYEDGKITNVLYDSEDVDYVVRYVGTAIDENKLLFNPDQTYISDNRTRVNDIPIKADFDLDDRYVSHVNSQNLPEANKSLARENIGAIPASYVKDGKLTIESSGGLVNNNIIFSANQEEDSYISLDLSEGIKSDISEGTEAYSWGDHSLEGYLKEIDLDGYATEDWVESQGYITSYEDTTYTAGEGLDLDGNEFSLTQSVLEAVSKAHTHPNKDILDGIDSDDIGNWDEAYAKAHEHNNKTLLDSLEQSDLNNWNEAYDKAHTHSNKTILDGISESDVINWDSKIDETFADSKYALRTRTITGTGSITGGGNLTSNRTLDLTQETKSNIAKGVDAYSYTLDDVAKNGNTTSVKLVGDEEFSNTEAEDYAQMADLWKAGYSIQYLNNEYKLVLRRKDGFIISEVDLSSLITGNLSVHIDDTDPADPELVFSQDGVEVGRIPASALLTGVVDTGELVAKQLHFKDRTGTVVINIDLSPVLDVKADKTVTISTGTGLSGGGTLASNRTINFDTTWGDSRYQRLLAAGDNITILGNEISATDTKYTAGNGLTLSGTSFTLPVSVTGSGSFVKSITQSTGGISVVLDTPPNTNTTYSNMTLSELNAGTVTTARSISAKTLNDWGTGKFALKSHTHNADDINAGVLNIARIPTGTSGSTVALGNHTHTWEQIENKPTNLETYGISDAVTLDNTGNKIGNYSASNIDGLDDLRTVVTYRGGNVLSMRRSSSYGGQFRNKTAGNNWEGRTLSNGVWSDWNRFWHDGDFSSNTISNWNQAYDWGNFRDYGLGVAAPYDSVNLLKDYKDVRFISHSSGNAPADAPFTKGSTSKRAGTIINLQNTNLNFGTQFFQDRNNGEILTRSGADLSSTGDDWILAWNENNLNRLNQIEDERVNYKSAQFASIDAARLTFKFRKAVEGSYNNRIALSFSIAPNGYNTNDDNNAVLVLKAAIKTSNNASIIDRYHTLSNYNTSAPHNYAWQDNTHIYVVVYMMRGYAGGFVNYSGTTEITYEDSYPYDPTEVPSNAASEVNERFATRNWVNSQGFVTTDTTYTATNGITINSNNVISPIYGTSANTIAQGNHTHTFASLTNKPTTIAGYGITDFNSLGDARWALRTRTITGTGSLTGGGNLTANRTLDLTSTAKSDIAKGVTAHGWGDFRDYGLGTEAVLKSGLLEDNNESGFYAFASSQQGFNFPRAMLLNRGSQNYGIIFSNSGDKVGFLTGDGSVYTAWHSGNLTNVSQLNNDAGYITSSSLPTVNNGQLTLSTGAGLSGSATFTANQSGSSTFSVAVASTHKLPTTAEWNALPTTNTITRLRGTTSGAYTSGDLTLLAGANTTITQSGANITIASTNTNTTYSGSTSITLSGTSFRRAALTGDVTAAANSNVTTISDDVVSSNHLKDNAIVNRHLNNGVVTTLKLANGSVTLEKMGSMPSKNIIGRYAITSGRPQYISMGESMEITDSGELEVKSSFVGGLYPFVHQDHGQCITVGQDKTRYLYTGPTDDNPICIMASLNDVGKELYIINKGGTRTIDTTSGTRFSPNYTGSVNISSINTNTTFHVRVLKRSNTNEAFFLILGDFKNDGQ